MSVSELAKLQRRTADEVASQVTHVKRTAKTFSLRELINSRMQFPMWVPDTRAIDVAQELSEGCRQRSGVAPLGTWVPLAALTRDLTASGSPAAVTGAVDSTLHSALSKKSAVMGGATVLSGLSGSNFGLPAFDAPINADTAWVPENGVGFVTDPTFKKAILTPKNLTFAINVSRRLLNNTSVDIETVLRAEILTRTMQSIDRAAVIGDGVNAPLGLLSNSGLQVLSAGTNGLAPSWDHVVEAEYQVSSRMGEMKAPAYLASPLLRKKLRKTQRAAGLDFILPADADQIIGHPLQATPYMPDNLTKGTSVGNCSAMLFGDLSELYVGFWGPLAIDLLVDSYSWSTSGTVRITVRCEVGVGVRNADAFVAYKDLLNA